MNAENRLHVECKWFGDLFDVRVRSIGATIARAVLQSWPPSGSEAGCRLLSLWSLSSQQPDGRVQGQVLPSEEHDGAGTAAAH